MPYPTTGNMAPTFADLSRLATESMALSDEARMLLLNIRPALIGQRVRRFNRMWQIVQVDVRGNAQVTCYGVTVSRSGKVGTRGFDLGNLDGCEFIDDKGNPCG